MTLFLYTGFLPTPAKMTSILIKRHTVQSALVTGPESQILAISHYTVVAIYGRNTLIHNSKCAHIFLSLFSNSPIPNIFFKFSNSQHFFKFSNSQQFLQILQFPTVFFSNSPIPNSFFFKFSNSQHFFPILQFPTFFPIPNSFFFFKFSNSQVFSNSQIPNSFCLLAFKDNS